MDLVAIPRTPLECDKAPVKKEGQADPEKEAGKEAKQERRKGSNQTDALPVNSGIAAQDLVQFPSYFFGQSQIWFESTCPGKGSADVGTQEFAMGGNLRFVCFHR